MKHLKLRPKVVRVNGKNYQVLFNEKNPLVEYANHGYCDNAKQVIHIEGEQTPFEECDTVIHELLHAVWSQMSLTDLDEQLEERIVRALGTGLTGLFSDNPSLLDYYKMTLAQAKVKR
jgi:Zn-dependent peptidase ImmA (M78 family)